MTSTEPSPRDAGFDTAHVAVAELGESTWRIDVTCHDRPGLLARVAGALTTARVDIRSATVTTGDDGVVIDSFVVQAVRRPVGRALADLIEDSLRRPLLARPVSAITVRFANVAPSRHTSCVVEADDRPGLLAALTTGFALAGVSVEAAHISTSAGLATDRFALTDHTGHPLDNEAMGKVRRALQGGRVPVR